LPHGSPAPSRRFPVGFAIAISLSLILACSAARAAPAPSSTIEEMPIEDLMKFEITSVSRKPQDISTAAAAIFVITGEDIRRSGATSLAEALRLAPGLQAARIDSSKWAVTARGFGGRFANKLLVLVDGRTAYTPTFSGVYWEIQDTLLEDVDRIEVIRGPGATLWGANAVNGVINIITKSSTETHGVLASATTGTLERAAAEARHGSTFGRDGHYRVYGKYFERAGADDERRKGDDWRMARAGFRAEKGEADSDLATAQGEVWGGKVGRRTVEPSLSAPYRLQSESDADMSGAHLLARWQHAFSPDSDVVLQGYYDRYRTDEPFYFEERETYDFDFQHRFPLGGRQEILWGAGIRDSTDEIQGVGGFVSTSPRAERNLINGFLQDDIRLVPERLTLTLGAKVEHFEKIGWAFQPNLRLLLTPAPDLSLWGSVSRAVRTPSRGEKDVSLLTGVVPPGTDANPGPLPVAIVISSSPGLDFEKLWAAEAGCRFRPAERLFVDAALFHNWYDRLRSSIRSAPVPMPAETPPYILTEMLLENDLEGRSYGAEVTADWQAHDRERLRLSYSWLAMDLRTTSGRPDSGSLAAQERNAPRHQALLRSSTDVGDDVLVDLLVRYVDRTMPLPSATAGTQPEPVRAYFTLDANLAWRPAPGLELAAGGKNLAGPRHLEYRAEVFFAPVEIGPSVYAKGTLRY
jgi:iron complex outermembrane receptor protein